MKKKIFMLLALFACVLSASADNTLAVNGAVLTKGKTGTFNIDMVNDDAITACQFKLVLPDGLTLTKITKTGRAAESHSVGSSTTGQTTQVTFNSGTNELVSGNSGALFIVTVEVDGSVDLGNVTAQLTDLELTTKDETKFNPANVNFQIEISDRVVLDENSTILPTAQNGVDVLVKRTIKAGVWNTICLPFDMNETQLKAAFGNDVKLAYLDVYTNAYSVDGSSVTVNFADWPASSGYTANYPLIIKFTGSDLTEFSVDNVNVTPDEGSAVSEWKLATPPFTLKARYTGTLKAGAVIPADNLFISNNKFYYSKGTTVIKAFRGYFYIKDFSSSSSAPEFVVNGNTTKIEGVQIITDNGQLYNLKGQKVDNPTQKGVYIQNGKKVVVK